MTIINRICFYFITILLIIIVIPCNAFASISLTIDCSDSDCTTNSVPLFSDSDGRWYPGRLFSRHITLNNSSSQPASFTLTPHSQNTNQLADALALSIVLNSTVIWAGSLPDFYNLNQLPLGTIYPATAQDYTFSVLMDPAAGNEYQHLQAVFSLDVVFTTEPSQPVVNGASTSNSSAPVCSDTTPGLPTNFQLVAGILPGQIILTWQKPNQPFTYFLIAYSDNPSWPPKWGNPNIGNVDHYTVSGLGGGNYWFWLRAGNGCAPGNFVGPLASGTIGGAATNVTAAGFEAGVLGAQTPGELGSASATQFQTGSVAGTSTQSQFPFWLLFLFIPLFLLLLFFIRRRRRSIELHL